MLAVLKFWQGGYMGLFKWAEEYSKKPMKKSNDCHPEPLVSGVEIKKSDPPWLKKLKQTGIPPVESPHRDKKSWPEDALGHGELDPDYGSYLTDDAEKVFRCPFYDCSMCESKCANRRTRSDLWELCFLCDEETLDIKAERERLELTIPELAKMSRVTGKTIKELEDFPSRTSPPQPRKNAKGIVINKQDRLVTSKTISKLAKAFLRQRDLASGIEKPTADAGFTTPKIVCDCCGHLSAPVRTGETSYPICEFCLVWNKRIAETDPLDHTAFFKDFPTKPRSRALQLLGRAEVIVDRSSQDCTCVFCGATCESSNTRGRACDDHEKFLVPLSVPEFEKRLQEAKDYNPHSDERMLQHRRKQAFEMVERNLQAGLPLSFLKGHRGIPDGIKTKGLATCNVCNQASFVWSSVKGKFKFIPFKPAPDAIGFTCGGCIARGKLTPVDRRLRAKERAKQERAQKKGTPKAKKKRKLTKKQLKQKEQVAIKGAPLKLFLEGLQMTQKELATDLGISPQLIGMMVRGEKVISSQVKKYMADKM